MKMFFIKYFVCIAVFTICFCIPLCLYAGLAITEVMYDVEGTDTGREWIEIHNSGTSPVDFSMWKLFEANTSHKVTALSSATIPGNGYAIISSTPEKFLADHSGFSGLIFDSVFSLSNDGETIALRNEAGEEVDTLTYDPLWGGTGDGNSLQKTAASTWVSAPPTPTLGTTATVSVIYPTDTSTETTSPDRDTKTNTSTTQNTDVYSTHSRQEVANTSLDTISFEITSGRPRIGFVGTPLSFEAKVKTDKYIADHNSISYMWSMGDGSHVSGKHISHVYQFPGDYIVILNSEVAGVYAVSKLKVRIISPRIQVAFAGEQYIELSNADAQEVNIGGWIIETKKKRFIAPEDTIIPPQASIKIPSNLSRLNLLDEYVRIANPLGTIISSLEIAVDQEMFSTQPTVVLPKGMSPSILEERLRDLVKKDPVKRSAKVSTTERTHAEKKKADSLLPPSEVPTTTQTIIYTKTQETVKPSWWNTITSFISNP